MKPLQTKLPVENVLLIVPPMILPRSVGRTSQPPLGLAYLAASLERAGHRVSILDSLCEGFDVKRDYPDGTYVYGLDTDEIARRVEAASPDVVGISCTSSLQYALSLEICRKISESNRSYITAIGGAHVSALPDDVLATGLIDIVTVGEAEISFPMALAYIAEGNIDALSTIEGIGFKTKNGFTRTPGVGITPDLDSIPLPARHLLPMDKYARQKAPHDATIRAWPATPVITSRGCPAKCTFCSIHTTMGKGYRQRSVESVLEELKILRDEYGIREIQFEDDNITLNRRHAMELFQGMIDNNLNLSWSTPNGVAMWTLTPELLDIMAASGCHKVNFAIESGVQRVLNEVIRKPLDLSKVPPLIKHAKKLGIVVHTFFIVGFPGETRQEMARTFKYAEKIDSDSTSFFIATPYPGTELYEQAKRECLLSSDFSFDGLNVYNATIKHPEISQDELTSWVRQKDAAMRFRRILRPENFRRALMRVCQDPKRLWYFAQEHLPFRRKWKQ